MLIVNCKCVSIEHIHKLIITAYHRALVGDKGQKLKVVVGLSATITMICSFISSQSLGYLTGFGLWARVAMNEGRMCASWYLTLCVTHHPDLL